MYERVFSENWSHASIENKDNIYTILEGYLKKKDSKIRGKNTI